MIFIYILIVFIFFIGGMIVSNILFGDQYYRYKQYWEKMRKTEGKYIVMKYKAKLNETTVNQIMHKIEYEIDHYGK